MNIIMGLNAPWIGGTRIHVLSLAQSLIQRGHSLTLVSDPGVLEDEMNRRGIPFVPRARGLDEMLRLMVELVDRVHPDIIHAHPAAFILESFLVSQITKIPFVVTMHGEYLMHFTCDSFGRQIGSGVCRVISVSDQIKEYLIQNSCLPDEKITVVPNGIDFSMYALSPKMAGIKTKLGFEADETIIMYLGRLDSDKREAITSAAEAIKLLRGLGYRAKGLFVGTGNLISELQSRDDIFLTGFKRNIPELLSVADLLVAAGRSALEGLAMGKPVVAAGRAGLLGLITHHNWSQAVATNFADHGALPRPDSRQVMAQIQLGLKPDFQSTSGKDLRQLTQDIFDIQKIVIQLEQIYEACLNKK